MELLRAEGLQVANIDATLIAQKPKLAPFIPEMRQNLSKHIGIPLSRINIKATTEEGLGFTGKEEGMAAHAVVLLETV
jgi:2-C-methyl-D-erythritol 2,4-cyclodiphosphate synthase